jgi:hypothetical protein
MNSARLFFARLFGSGAAPPHAAPTEEQRDPYRDVFHAKAEREAARAREPRFVDEHPAPLRATPASSPDADFEAAINGTIPLRDQEKAFYTTVAGTSHRNPDGTSRIKAIKECEVLDSLSLVWEQENKFDPNAIAVRDPATGDQLGYLPSHLAAEVCRDLRKHGPCWAAFFRQPNLHPETDRVVGASIYMVRVTDAFVARREMPGAG